MNPLGWWAYRDLARRERCVRAAVRAQGYRPMFEHLQEWVDDDELRQNPPVLAPRLAAMVDGAAPVEPHHGINRALSGPPAG